VLLFSGRQWGRHHTASVCTPGASMRNASKQSGRHPPPRSAGIRRDAASARICAQAGRSRGLLRSMRAVACRLDARTIVVMRTNQNKGLPLACFDTAESGAVLSLLQDRCSWLVRGGILRRRWRAPGGFGSKAQECPRSPTDLQAKLWTCPTWAPSSASGARRWD
jgi:hypothetical protein